MNLKLKILNVKDVSEKYVLWYIDIDVVKFSNNQYRKFSLDGQREYVASCLESSDKDLYGIFDDNFHIGNIVINGLKLPHKNAEITYVIGEKSYWNKGVATFAISEIVKFATIEYKLHKLFASLAENNTGSKRALEKNNFVLEGKRKEHLFFNGKFFNQLDYGLLLPKKYKN